MRILLAGFLVVGSLRAQPYQFEKQTLADDLKGGYQVIACDVNGDGKQDLIALASDLPDLLWFENPSWQRHVLARNMSHMINAACWSKAPDRPPVIAVASEFSMHPERSVGLVSLLMPNDDVREPWKAREIDRLPASHRLRWADIDGSGKHGSGNKVLINAPLAAADAKAPDYRGHAPLVYYRPGEWKRLPVGDAEEGILHGIFVTDWDGNGRQDILIGSFSGIHLYRFLPDGKWSRTAIADGSPQRWPKSGTSDVTVGHVGSERFLAAIEPWHGNEVAVYRHNGKLWRREVIDDTILDGHTIQTVDLNHDGNDEIVAGFRGKPYGVYLYSWMERSGSGRLWRPVKYRPRAVRWPT